MAHKSRLRSPVSWFGGKSGMVKHLLPLFPPHHIYVEPFGGGASVLIAKEPSAVEVYNDLDSGLVGFFRVLRNPEQFASLQALLAVTPYSREEYQYCLATWEECEDPVHRAHRWFVVAKSSFSGLFGNSWGSTVAKSSRGMAGCASKWLSAIDLLPEVCNQLLRVQVENADFRRIFDRYDTSETLFYCDPPYVPDTRKSGSYRHELALEDHQVLVAILLSLQGKAILSGYDHPVYQPLLENGWTHKQFETICHAAGRTRASGLQGEGNVLAKQRRIEHVWLSPGCLPAETML